MRRGLGRIGAALTVWQVAVALREHWLSLPRSKRDRVAALVTQSRLRPANLSRAQQAELRGLIRELRLPHLGQRLATIAFTKRRGAAGRR